MPVEFLSSEQKAQYGRYSEDPTAEQLSRYFWLDDQDRAIIRLHRGNHNRMGFALQLVTVRYFGTFLENPTDVPKNVLLYISSCMYPLISSLGIIKLVEFARNILLKFAGFMDIGIFQTSLSIFAWSVGFIHAPG